MEMTLDIGIGKGKDIVHNTVYCLMEMTLDIGIGKGYST